MTHHRWQLVAYIGVVTLGIVLLTFGVKNTVHTIRQYHTNTREIRTLKTKFKAPSIEDVRKFAAVCGRDDACSATVLQFVAKQAERGAKGENGQPGLRGLTGLRGPRGKRGPPGARGPSGPPGRSAQGPRGARGTKGEPGRRGSKGAKGASGPQGPPGTPGPPGGTGPPGPPGVSPTVARIVAAVCARLPPGICR